MTHTAAEITHSRLGFGARKPGLAELYREWYRLQQDYLADVKGEILELGSGAGFIQEVIPRVITSDLVACEGVDLSLNGLEVGEKFPNRLSNLIMVNVFHHICNSTAFLMAASNALVPGGRLIMIEPWLNNWSRLCYQLVGHEPLDPDQEGWSFPSNDPLLDANQAQPWIVFKRDEQMFRQRFPEFSIVKLKPLMPLTYILSGGHSVSWGLPARGIKLCRSLERRLGDRRFGMFTLIVVEKST